MPRLTCEGRDLATREGESVLETLERAGLPVTSSCRAGACQSCLVRASRGMPPAASQRGVKASLAAQGYFLACQAKLDQDLEISLAADSLEVPAAIENVELLAADVLRVTLRPTRDFEHRAGQFVTLVRSDGVARAYSIASLPRTRRLELHVRVLPGGAMSSWLSERESIGQSLKVRGPAGECFYLHDEPDEALLLAGVGTGLAPLWGVLNDALGAGHTGPIELWHGARNAEGLYLHRELLELARLHPRFTYRACVLEGQAPEGATQGKLDEQLMASATSFAGRRVYLCGDAPLVQLLKRKVFMKGAASSAIHADPFIGSAPQGSVAKP